MFRNSFLAMLAAALLALAGIVVYVALNESGPDDTIAEARTALGKGDASQAIYLLNLAEVSLRNDPQRREALLRLRYAANSDIGDAPAALRDLDELLLHHRGDEDLRLDRIRLLALSDDGSAARAAAHQFLSEHPGHSRGLELAGETCQKLYQPQLLSLRASLERELGPAQRAPANADLLAYVYRPEGDPQVVAAAARLRALYTTEANRMAAWTARWQSLQELRTAVQEALRYFQQSLEAGGKPVAAFRAFAFALEQAQRRDDLLLACEVQRRQFDHDYVVEGGAIAAWSLLQAGLPAAAAATTKRWLQPDVIKKTIAAGVVNPAISDLLLAQIFAAWQMRDTRMLGLSWQIATDLEKAKVSKPLPLPLVSALQQCFGDAKHIDSILPWGWNAALQEPFAGEHRDALPGLARLQIERLAKKPGSEAEQVTLLRKWATTRPDSLEPRIVLVEHLASRGETAAALLALGEARTLDATDPRLFPLQLQIARSHYRNGPQDGPALLAQCVRRLEATPEVTDPIGYLLCAEAALAAAAWPVAIGSAGAAIAAFPRERQPRLLEVRAMLGAGRTEESVRTIDRMVMNTPDDPETLQLARTIYRAAQRSPRPLLGRLLACTPPEFSLQQDVLESLRDHAPRRASQFVSPAVAAGDVPLRALAALTLARAGQTAPAEQLLDGALAAAKAPTPACRDDLVAGIVATAIAATADGRADAELAPLLARRLTAIEDAGADNGRALLAAARRLAATHPRSAAELFEAGAPLLAPADRTGADFVLAGHLDAARGRWRTAEEQWTAALGFDDGDAAAEPLAHLLLAQGRTERARTVYALVTNPTDPALARLFGSAEQTMTLLAKALQTDAADLLAHCLLALEGQPAMVDWQATDVATNPERHQLLAALHDDALAPLVLPRLRALHEREPTSRTTRLLLARAQAAKGNLEAAMQQHAELHRAGLSDPVFFREVARAAEAPGYCTAPELRNTITGQVPAGAANQSPLTIAYANRQRIAALVADGQPELADQLRLADLLRAPATAAWTAAELDLLTRKVTPFEVCTALNIALAGPKVTQRGPLVDVLHRTTRALLQQAPAAIPAALAAAQRDLAVDGARGPVVHLLLQYAPAIAESLRRQLLQGHLALVAHGDDDGDELDATIAALVSLDGLPAVLLRIEQLLREEATALPLWLARARLTADSPDGARMLNELRSVVAHANAPQIELGWLILAAEACRLDPHAIARVAALGAVLGSPDGADAAAMIALRTGMPDAAESAFALAGPQANGMHLFGRALAALQGGTPDGPARARILLEQLQRDYPSSSAARNAGTFKNQLAPR